MLLSTRKLALLALANPVLALIRFQCSQLVVERLDPLVTPGQIPSPHVHQIVGGNSFNATMEPSKDMPGESTCTTCQFSEDFRYVLQDLTFELKKLTRIATTGLLCYISRLVMELTREYLNVAMRASRERQAEA